MTHPPGEVAEALAATVAAVEPLVGEDDEGSPVIHRELTDPEYPAVPDECPHPTEGLRRFGNLVRCGVCGARVA